MTDPQLKEALSTELGITIKSIRSISGGDISRAYSIESKKDKYFLKVNDEAFALNMFQKEKLGLQQIGKYNTLKVPEVYQIGHLENSAFILMEFINTESIETPNFIQFGTQLAELHLQFGVSYGWQYDNYIGSLFQSNSSLLDWSEFYVNNRLAPQIKLAVDQHLLDKENIPTLSDLSLVCNRLFVNAKPSPIHGDLWSGNYINDNSGEVFLIDPAFYFGFHEVDIAMSKLFGGFPIEFYEAYYSVFPMLEDHSERIQILQLYYLLVHLNLFGDSYLSQVISILSKY